MKTRIAFVTALLVAANSLFAQAALPAAAPGKAAQPASKPAAPAKAAEKTAPAKADPKAPGAKKDDKKAEEEGKIRGQAIARANGTFLGLEVAGGNFKLSFYDKKKKPAAVDVDRANVRWPNTRGPGDNRVVLLAGGDGKSMTGAKFVNPPYNFKVFLTLVKGEGETAQTESYTIDFRAGGG